MVRMRPLKANFTVVCFINQAFFLWIKIMCGHLQLAANWRTADIDDRQRAILEFAIDLCHCRPVTEVDCTNIHSLFPFMYKCED